MKYCVNCGQECNNHDVYCPNCGCRCDVKNSKTKDYESYDMFSIIVMLLFLASIISSTTIFLVEFFNGVTFTNPAFDNTLMYTLAWMGQIFYIIFGVFVMVLYHLDVRRGTVRVLTKVLSLFVSVIACIMLLFDKDR